MPRTSDKRRLELLGSAGTAMALIIAGSTFGAQIAGAATTDANNAQAIADKTAVSQSTNSTDVQASIANTVGGVHTDATSGGSNTNTVTGNDVLAAATGNAFHNQIDLSTVSGTGATGGAAALGISANQSGANISSAVTSNDVTVDLVNFSNGSAVNDGNRISATTTANKGSTLLTGPLANDFSSTAAGLVSTIGTLPGNTLSTTSAGITASTHQTSSNPANSAIASGNTIGTFIESAADNTVTASPSVSSNAITASVTGNASQSTINIASNNTPDYAGSAAVANAQGSTGEGSSVAVNANSRIVGEVYAPALPVNTLSGSLAVENNTISSSASNNVALGNGTGRAGNEIVLGDTLSFSGANTPTPFFSTFTLGVNEYFALTASDLAVQNVQTATGDAIRDRITTTAQTLGGEVSGSAEALSSGSISLTGNAITATAQSNAASSRIASGDDAALFDGSAAVSNRQSNTFADIAASNQAGSIIATVIDEFANSSVAADGNAVRASAYGNQVSQSIDLSATNLAIGTGNANTSTAVGANVTAPVTVGSVQSNVATTVSAAQQSVIGASWLGVDDSTMVGSSLSASGNTQDAVAVGNSATNGLTLEGTTVGTGAAVANLQVSDPTSSVTATSAATAVNAYANGDVTNGETLLNDNLQRSLAYGASSNNALSVDGTSITVSPGTGPGVSIGTSLNTITQSLDIESSAAYSLVNFQGQAGDVSATADTPIAFHNNVTGHLDTGSTQNTDGNTYVAAAYGTDARNIASIDANAINAQTIGQTTVATAVNAQVAANTDILARAAGDTVVRSSVGNDVAGSSVSTSENAIQALAFANRNSATQIAVKATNVDTAFNDVTVPANTSFDEITLTGTVSAAFAAQNAQFSSGSVTASLLTDDINPDSARILTTIGDDVLGSSVISDNNMSAAGATGNRGATSILLDANQLNTSAAVQNAQTNTADLAALIGIAGTPGTPGTPGTSATPVSASGTAQGTMSISGDMLTVSGSAVTVTFSGHSFTSAEVAYLNGLSGISGATMGGNTVTFAAGTINTSVFNNFSFNSGSDGSSSGDEQFTVTGFTIPGTPPTAPTFATPNQGGVMIAIGDLVIDSAVSVSGNRTSGSVIGNSASNAISASATEISNGSGITISEAALLDTEGDLVLSNLQRDTAASEQSTVYGTFAIDAIDSVIDGSTLSVSNNIQRSDAGSNVATNVISASATNISAVSALTSSQTSSAAVSALSDLDLFAPGASRDSITKITDNTNTARAVVNEATNVVQVTATNAGPASPSNLASVSALAVVNADHAMLNVQAAQGEANSAAVSRIYNGDSASLETDGLRSGSIDFRGNATIAQSVANLATNEMTVAASANHTASAAINNAQESSADVTADATSSVQVVLAGYDADAPLGLAASDSSIRVNNNATTAVARGNSASNVLNMEAGASYGTPGGAMSVVDFGSGGAVTAFNAKAGVLNQQSNTGTVSANSTGVVYQVALNGLDTSALVSGSALSVSGNVVNAEAYGNTASNRIVMTALNSGTPSAAIGNYQSNSAGVTATVTNVGYGITAGSGVIGNSTFSTTGNRVAATAVGNNAVSVISAGN